MIKKISVGLLTFIFTAAVLVGILTASAMIPTKAIKDNFISSMEFFIELDNSAPALVEPNGFTLDRYADINLLEIAYQLDSSAPFTSVISSMYTKGTEYQPEKLIEIAENDISPTVSYSRYWHGTVLFLRFFMLFMDIRGIYILNLIIFIILTAILCRMLVKRSCTPIMVFLMIGLVLTRAYLMPFCIEYISSGMLMLIASIVILWLDTDEHRKYIPYAFISIGVAICFFDFLTAETLTLSLPLVLLLSARGLKGKNTCLKENIILCVKCIILWLVSYASMFALKWGISSIVSSAESIGSILDHASIRISYDPTDAPYRTVISALTLNVTKLVFLSFTKTYTGVFTVVIVYILAILGFIYMFRRRDCDLSIPILIFVIGLIPFGRYIILSPHSQDHSIFTYRAQLSTIVAALSAIMLCIDLSIFGKKTRRDDHKKHKH